MVTILLVIGIVIGGPAVSPPQAAETRGPKVLPSHRVLRRDFPPPTVSSGGFAVCEGGVVLVPTRGGLAAAGWGGWLREPPSGDEPNILAAACDVSGQVWLVDDQHRLQRIEGPIHNGPRVTVATLVPARYELRPAADGSLWILGRASEKVMLGRWSEKRGWKLIWSGKALLGGIAPIGRNSLLTCGAKGVDLWRAGRPPKRLFDLPQRCDGIAVDATGLVYVSVPRGVFILDPKARPKILLDGIHGPLVHDGRALFVVAAEYAAVLELLPKRGQ